MRESNIIFTLIIKPSIYNSKAATASPFPAIREQSVSRICQLIASVDTPMETVFDTDRVSETQTAD